MIFHLALASDWAHAQKDGEYRISTSGTHRWSRRASSTPPATCPQARAVAARFYADVTEPLLLLHIDETRLEVPVVLETPPDSAEQFPHIYGPLPVPAVAAVTPFSLQT